MNQWNLLAPVYDRLRRTWPLNVILERELEKVRFLAGQVVQEGKTILDLGTGTGVHLKIFNPQVKVIGLDRSERMASVGRSRCRAFILARAEHLPLKSRCIDILSAVGLLEYIRSGEKLFKELYRVGNAPGYLLITSSPGGLFTFARLLTGAKIYLRSTKVIRETAHAAGYTLLSETKTFSQCAFLLRKK
jgi:ubiquinone/menaquinone biosynthesis C-methylase UbiE